MTEAFRRHQINALTKRIEGLAQFLTQNPRQADSQRIESFLRFVDERGRLLQSQSANLDERKEQN